ncbi:MAG: hypothetical protein RR202_10605 [Bacteroidales bacterium]
MKKTQKLRIIHDPLHQAFSLVVKGGSLLQVHAAEVDEYIPDRRITPLIIQPVLHVTDPSGIIASGHKEDEITDARWYIGTEESKNQITSATDGYTIGLNGKLTVAKNIKYLYPVTLIFTAIYFDNRSGKSLKLHDKVTLSTTSLLEKPVTMQLDKPGSWYFDPLSDQGNRSIRASIFLAEDKLSDDRLKIWWYKIVNGTEVLISSEDLWYISGQNTTQLEIDPRYVNGKEIIVAKSEFLAANQVAPNQPTSDCQTAMTTIVRRYGEYEWDCFIHGGNEVSATANSILAESVIHVGRTLLENASRYFDIEWFIRRNVHGAQWTTLGYGESIRIPRSDYEIGAELSLEVREKGSLKPLSKDGNILCINGKPLIL